MSSMPDQHLLQGKFEAGDDMEVVETLTRDVLKVRRQHHARV